MKATLWFNSMKKKSTIYRIKKNYCKSSVALFVPLSNNFKRFWPLVSLHLLLSYFFFKKCEWGLMLLSMFYVCMKIQYNILHTYFNCFGKVTLLVICLLWFDLKCKAVCNTMGLNNLFSCISFWKFLQFPQYLGKSFLKSYEDFPPI